MFDASGYWLSRFLFQRGIALVYLIAFIVALNQWVPLLGERGLLPAVSYLKQVSFRDAPSLFHFSSKDSTCLAAAWLGIAVSMLAVSGVSERFGTWFSMLVWVLLWALYISFVNAGQIFYAFGWESILLEAGFFAIFLGSSTAVPSRLMIWMIRWLEFRVMFGAGLIKLRGDPCWQDWTCLDYHYETQPMPSPLGWFFHWGPQWTHRAGIGFNHFAELIVPFGYFLPQPVAGIAGLVTIAFQGTIMASGNLSWLNLMTIVLAIPALDDRLLSFIPLNAPALHPQALPYKIVVGALAAVVAAMSVNPVRNMLSPGQVMNLSYNPLHLVGTYGAFGSVTRNRDEVIVEGTDEVVVTPGTKWREYEFKGKPGALDRMPPQIAPYHLRLDWLMWFAAMSDYDRHPWFVRFMAKLLEGDKAILNLLKTNPFPDHPPRYVRALRYRYRFTNPAERKQTGNWWKREPAGSYFPVVNLDSPGLR